MTEVLQFPSLPADTGARAAALDTRSSCIVEAPAGSGKTGLMVARYLKLLGDPSVEQPEEVLAITFTRKATAELRERILDQLCKAAALRETSPEAGDLSERLKPYEQETQALALAALQRGKSFGWDILEQPARLNIRSIDSVCAQIANALPILSGAGGPRQTVEDASRLYQLAARRTFLQLGNTNTPAEQRLDAALRTLLLHRDGNLADCEALVTEMLKGREQWGELAPIFPARASGTQMHAELEDMIHQRLERSLENIVSSGLSRARHAMPADALQDLATLAAKLSCQPGINGNPSPIALCAGREQPPGTKAEDFDHWVALIRLLLKSDGQWRKRFTSTYLKFELPKAEAKALQEIAQTLQSLEPPDDELREALAGVLNLPPARYPAEQWEMVKALFHILQRALAELRLVFAERGQSDFTEFALSARAALRVAMNPDLEAEVQTGDAVSELMGDLAGDLALWAGTRLRHILVDEMQDTSSGQYELLNLLTRSWDGHTQTLFLVGDPKQSIYLFRQARVERFLRTALEHRLGDLELRPLTLTANFRSQAKLVSGFNAIFHQIFPHSVCPQAVSLNSAFSEGVDVPFVEAHATRPTTNGAGVVWHPEMISNSDSTSNSRATIAAKEAREIRRIIEQRQAMPLPPNRAGKPWSIAVLGRTRLHLEPVIEEFKQDRGAGPLPYRAIDLDPLDELPEVLDALALTRALLHPADRVAWLAVLRAPWCGLGLADLLRLTGDNAAPASGSQAEEDLREWTVEELVRARHEFLSPQGQQHLNRVWPTLETAVATRGRTSLATHVERTWRSLGGDLALPEPKRRNVRRYLELLLEVEIGAERIDLNQLNNRLKDLYAEPDPAVMQDGRLQVELLTIHKAKGLEWDLVLIPGLDRSSGQNRSVLLNWLEFDQPAGPDQSLDQDEPQPAIVVLAPIDQKGGEKGRLSQWLNRVRARREAAERKRIFYVAATRAREELHLFATASVTMKGELAQPRFDSLLKACWPAAKPHFDRLLSERATPAGDAGLEMAAFGTPAPGDEEHPAPAPQAATIERLPLSFDPSARFRSAEERRLLYPSALELRHTAPFHRPEGSFAARAFGNVVHRYLQRLAMLLQAKADLLQSPADFKIDDSWQALATEIPSWRPALLASLRGEGLSSTLAQRESARAERALTLTLHDPVGRWILSPHPSAASEQTLKLTSPEAQALRLDRTFLAAAEPIADGSERIWIVDFKTTEQGNLSDADFEAEETAKYKGQMEAYAALRRTLPDGDLPIRLGLYYPLIPRLLHWPAAPSP